MISLMVSPSFFLPQRSRKCFVLFGRSWWRRHFLLFSYFWLDRRNHRSFEDSLFTSLSSFSDQSESKSSDHYNVSGAVLAMDTSEEWVSSQLVYCRWLETGVLLYRALGTLNTTALGRTRSLYIASETVGGEMLWQKKMMDRNWSYALVYN